MPGQNLGPYATRLAIEVLNITPRTKDGRVPITLLPEQIAHQDWTTLIHLDALHMYWTTTGRKARNLENGKPEVV